MLRNRCAVCAREGFRVVHVLRLARGDRRGRASSARRSTPTAAATPARSTSSATSTAAMPSSSRCSTRSATRSARTRAGRSRAHPDGRRAVFLGDLVDRGPGIVPVLRLVMDMVAAGSALCVPGNHEHEAAAQARRQERTVSHGLAETLAQIDALPAGEREAFAAEVRGFIDGLVSHYWLDGGKLVVAHAGLAGGDARPRLRRGAGVRALRRDDRRDRRVRPAGALRLGHRVPRRGGGRLRPHAGAARGVGQQHDLPRHRLRVRRAR